MSTLTLHFGPTVSLAPTPGSFADPKMFRAFALVCPTAWGRGDWKCAITAVLHPADLVAADVTIADVIAAVAFFTATEANVHESQIFATPEISAYVVKAAGYRMGPAH